MVSKSILGALAALGAVASFACSGSQPTPAEPAAPAPSVQASAEAAPPPSASATAAAEAAPPADPLLAGFTGQDLDWGQKCLGGDGSYCTGFGNRNEFATKDFAKAFVWYKKGCEGSKSKDPTSCMGVARLTIGGQGTTADVAGGLQLWEATCAMESGRDACSELAKAYETGNLGVKKNAKKAKELYAKTCEMRDLTACKKAGKKPPAAK